MTKAIYPGSFDPITNGHIDVAIRASESFEELTIGMMVNPKKSYYFSMEELIRLAQDNLSAYPNIKVVGFQGLLVDYMKENEITTIIKGLRTVTDYEYEFQMALLNKRLYKKAETMFLPTSEQYSLISSSMVKELAAFGGDISEFVPSNVREAILSKK